MEIQDSKVKIQKKYQEDIYDKTFLFSISIVQFIQMLPNDRTFWVIKDQVLRSGTSIGANIIEGKSSSSRKEFIRYFEIALNETMYWLQLLNAFQNRSEISSLMSELDHIRKVIASIVIKLKK